MKRIIAFFIVFLTFSTSTLAQQLTPSELDFVFERSDNLELAYLSDTEMQQTKGAVIWAPIIGAVNGAGWYAWGAYRGHYSWNTYHFIGNTVFGAATGSYFGWGAISAAGGSLYRSFTTIGSLVWRANGWILNNGLNYIWRR